MIRVIRGFSNAGFRLTFTGTGSAACCYLGLDNVSVVPSEAAGLELKIESPPAGSVGNQLQLTFTPMRGQKYAVQTSDDLLSGSWGILAGTEGTGTGERVQIDLPNVISQRARFFRLQVGP